MCNTAFPRETERFLSSHSKNARVLDVFHSPRFRFDRHPVDRACLCACVCVAKVSQAGGLAIAASLPSSPASGGLARPRVASHRPPDYVHTLQATHPDMKKRGTALEEYACLSIWTPENITKQAISERSDGTEHQINRRAKIVGFHSVFIQSDQQSL